jgi:Bacteriocin-protection, YdeI or OmpD-Associated
MGETLFQSETYTLSGQSGPLHKIPRDMRMALSSGATTQAAWKDLTPLARNEWICWVISAKQETTRTRRLQRVVEELEAGKRRPCCWPGCPHRRPGARKWF